MASLVRLACIEAGLGRGRDCLGHAAQALNRGGPAAFRRSRCEAGEAVGFLELGLDRVDSAIDTLEGVAQLTASIRTRARRPPGRPIWQRPT